MAAPDGYVEDRGRVLRVATKFAHVARDYYAGLGREIEPVSYTHLLAL